MLSPHSTARRSTRHIPPVSTESPALPSDESAQDAEKWCAHIGAAIAATCCGGSRVGVSSRNLFGTARTDVLDKWATGDQASRISGKIMKTHRGRGAHG